MGDYNFIKSWRQDGIGFISINRPPFNVLDIPTMEELNEAIVAAKADELALQALVITGEGERAFSAGVDVADHTEEKMEHMLEVFHELFRNLDQLEIPVIAAVKGAALGGGCELALYCDMIIAADNLKIGQPEIKVGVFPPVAAVMLPRSVPEKLAFELLVTGEALRAERAKECGLVNCVHPLPEFDDSFAAFLTNLRSLSGAVLRMTKRAIRKARGLPFPEALHKVEELYLGELMETEDAKEGLAAFMEKRAPVWKHR